MERFQRVGQNMLHKTGIIRVIINDIITIVYYLIIDDGTAQEGFLLLEIKIKLYVMIY